MKQYNLTIKPAIDIENRMRIIDLLKELGYKVWASGQEIDGSECDIAFEEIYNGLE